MRGLRPGGSAERRRLRKSCVLGANAMVVGSGSASTAAKHRVFSDLFRLSTYLIPRSRLPKLPRELEDAMGYRYSAGPSER